MYCSSCGKDMPHDARFCPACGRANAVNSNAYAPPYPGPMPSMDGLVRPRDGRKVGGVCAAFCLRYGWDLSLTRLLTVLIALFTFPFGAIVYVIMWVVLPEASYMLPATVATPVAPYGGSTGV